MRALTVNRAGQSLRAVDSGGSGPAVLLCHPFGAGTDFFAAQMQAFAQRCRCVSFDQRAHGGSTTDRPFDLWDSARDGLAVLDALGVERAVLVGTSMGSFVAQRAALLAPDRVAGLLLVSSTAAAEDPAMRAGYLALADAFASGERSAADSVVDAAVMICYGDDADTAAWRARLLTWPVTQARLALDACLSREDLRPRMRELSMPVTLVHGLHDRSYPLSAAQQIADSVPDCRGLRAVIGGAHFLSYTHPEPVNDALADLLEACC